MSLNLCSGEGLDEDEDWDRLRGCVDVYADGSVRESELEVRGRGS